MPDKNIIKATGTIIKEEMLTNIEHTIMPNTLVLESSLPFPGYHGSNLPEKSSPNMIYLVTENRYDGEDILRAAKRVKRIFTEKFDASYGKAVIYSSTYYFIRIKNLGCFDCIAELQEAFTREGIVFMKKRPVSTEALIKIQKFFFLEKMDEYLYRDTEDYLMYYFEIPEKPEWSFFKKITVYIRGNIDNYTFDAALGVVYHEEVKDLVRIYAKDITIDQLHFIRRKYLYELAHPDHLD
jgi:hypothetical protein